MNWFSNGPLAKEIFRTLLLRITTTKLDCLKTLQVKTQVQDTTHCVSRKKTQRITKKQNLMSSLFLQCRFFLPPIQTMPF